MSKTKFRLCRVSCAQIMSKPAVLRIPFILYNNRNDYVGDPQALLSVFKPTKTFLNECGLLASVELGVKSEEGFVPLASPFAPQAKFVSQGNFLA